MSEYFADRLPIPEKIHDELLVRSLTAIWRRLRENQVAAFRCENALMYYQHPQLREPTPGPTPQPTPEPPTPPTPTKVSDAVRRVINGEPITSREIFDAVKTRYPSLTVSRSAVCNALVRLCDSGALSKSKVTGDRSTFTKCHTTAPCIPVDPGAK